MILSLCVTLCSFAYVFKVCELKSCKHKSIVKLFNKSKLFVRVTYTPDRLQFTGTSLFTTSAHV